MATLRDAPVFTSLIRALWYAAVPAGLIGLAVGLMWRASQRGPRVVGAGSGLIALAWVVLWASMKPWEPGPPVGLPWGTALRKDMLWVINPIGVAAAVLALCALRGARRKAGRRPPVAGSRLSRGPMWMGATLLLPMAAAYLWYAWPPLRHVEWQLRTSRFDQARWVAAAADDGYGRAPMLRSLFRHVHVLGKTRNEIETLLGHPEEWCGYTGYPVAAEPDLEPAHLVFYYGPDGRVWAYGFPGI